MVIEDSRWNITVDHRHVLIIWENYTAELYDRPNRQENFEVEREEEVYAEEKGPYVFHGELEKAIKEVRHKKAIEDNDDVPWVVLKSLGAAGLKVTTQPISSVYGTGGGSKDFIDVAVIAFNKKPKASKHCDHLIIRHIARTAKIDSES